MAKQGNRAFFNELAKHGAAELLREMRAREILIFKTYPELRKEVGRRRVVTRGKRAASNNGGAPKLAVVDLRGEEEKQAAQVGPARKRRRISAAGRKAISIASKKRWAKVRADRKAQASA